MVLPEAHVVGDEQVDARQQQRLAQRLELVGVDADAGAIRRLKQLRVGRGDRVPAERAVVGGEPASAGRTARAPASTSRPRSSAGRRAPSPRAPRAPRPRRRLRGRTGGRASGRPGAGGGSTASTRYRRERTRTISPGVGRRSGEITESGIWGISRPGERAGPDTILPVQDGRVRSQRAIVHRRDPRPGSCERPFVEHPECSSSCRSPSAASAHASRPDGPWPGRLTHRRGQAPEPRPIRRPGAFPPGGSPAAPPGSR